MEVPVPKKTPFWHSLSFKLIVVGILVLLMLIPGAMIRRLITEREQAQLDVTGEIGSKWGTGQTLTGPVLTIPYYNYIKDGDKTYRQTDHAHFLPEDLRIEATVEPGIRYRGIYRTVVYTSRLRVYGEFLPPDPATLKLENKNVLFSDAFLQVGIPDMRGIQEKLTVGWNSETLEVEPGIPSHDIVASGFHAKVPLDGAGSYRFDMNIILNGSSFLFFTPAGKFTGVKMVSDWEHPKFDGAFLPDERKVDENGFTALWQVLHLNRNFPQCWTGNAHLVEDAAFGVEMFLAVDQYRKTMRSAKYAIMFIALTFMVFFFVEVLNKKRIHPVQYLLVGLSISIFYVLLLSLAEHISFNLAYLVSSLAVVALISAYSVAVFRNTRLTLILCACLVILYAFLFSLIQLKDYALLMGAVGLFVAMAIIMYASRNVDWYSATSAREKDRQIGF
jgi:inner membrane protein